MTSLPRCRAIRTVAHVPDLGASASGDNGAATSLVHMLAIRRFLTMYSAGA